MGEQLAPWKYAGSPVTHGFLADGERSFGYEAQDSSPRKLEVNLGTRAAPDTGFGPTAAFSRILEVAEAEFPGDGEGDLAALRASAVALVGSQGQAIGGAFTGETYSSWEPGGGHSLADGVGITSVGISRAGSTRTGLGGFFNGRRESVTGRSTGIEVVSDSEPAEAGEAYTGEFPHTKGIHLHAVGNSRSAVGLLVSNVGVGYDVAIAAMTGASINSAFIRDDSEAPRSIVIRGKHAKAAIAVGAGSGPIVIGEEEVSTAGLLFEVNPGETSTDPVAAFGSGKNINMSVILNKSGNGQQKAFVANGNDQFVKGTVSGDTGFNFISGKTWHVGPAGETSMLRVSKVGVGFNGAAPVAKAAEIAIPAETFAAQKAFNEAVKAVLKNVGFTA